MVLYSVSCSLQNMEHDLEIIFNCKMHYTVIYSILIK